MKNLPRREFIVGSVAAAAGCRMFNAGCGDSYSVAVLGDTHYDAEPKSVYHSHYDNSNRWAKIQNAEFERNGKMWRERCPKLLAASAELAHAHETDFILQLGDIIQGDCDHVPTHKKMLDDCIKVLRKPYPAATPFLTVVGNHDFRGKGAWEAYFDFAEPFMTAEIAKLTGNAGLKRLRYPVFSFRKGPDLWIFCNFETRDLNPICDIIDADPSARRVFIATHGPFTTYPRTKSYRWRLGGSKQSEPSRKRLYETLSRRHAVVLSGHTHTTTFSRHENAFGSFCEFTANSVWTENNAPTCKPLDDGPSQYRVAPGMFKDSRQQDIESETAYFKKGLVRYFNNRAAGHYRLDVSSSDIKMSFYPGDAREPARVFDLT